MNGAVGGADMRHAPINPRKKKRLKPTAAKASTDTCLFDTTDALLSLAGQLVVWCIKYKVTSSWVLWVVKTFEKLKSTRQKNISWLFGSKVLFLVTFVARCDFHGLAHWTQCLLGNVGSRSNKTSCHYEWNIIRRWFSPFWMRREESERFRQFGVFNSSHHWWFN